MMKQGEPGGSNDAGVPEPTLRRVFWELLLLSFVVLFQELAIIRWLPGQVRVLAYFPNLILLSAFLGLGMGCLRADRRPLRGLWPASLLLLALAALGLGGVVFTQNSASEHLWLLYYDQKPGAPVVGDVRTPIVIAFVLSALTFVPLGQMVAERFDVFRRRSSPLWGYSADLLGSLLGVVVFSLVSFAGTSPPLWFVLVFAAALPFYISGLRPALAYAAAGVAVVALVAFGGRADFYSPYYALAIRDTGPTGFSVLANGSLHQVAVRLDREAPLLSPFQGRVRTGYHLPYDILARAPGRVLVLGAGTGNDVAVALDRGAEHVDAVEIDPLILKLGRDRHPNHPYASPRVTVVNGDARSFLNASHEKYDLIVFGTLDSMTRLSALSNVRLDNFVYTLESVAAARDHLSAQGGLVLYFMVGADYIDVRLPGLLTKAFGQPPLVVADPFLLFNRIYLAGPAFTPPQDAAKLAEARRLLGRIEAELRLPSDDWPYLYLRSRGISSFYLSLIAALAGLSMLGVAAASRDMRRSLLAGRGVDLEMFLLGLGFLLLETKAVTEMNLVWGATWLTSGVVFAAVLIVILLGTVGSRLRPLPWSVSAVGLIAALLLVYFIPARLLLSVNPPARLALSIAFVGAPILFAATTFASVFASRRESGRAYGWNVLGAVAGGLLEFLSMAVGLRALVLVALAAYLGAFLVHLRRASEAEPEAPTTDSPRLAGSP